MLLERATDTGRAVEAKAFGRRHQLPGAELSAEWAKVVSHEFAKAFVSVPPHDLAGGVLILNPSITTLDSYG